MSFGTKSPLYQPVTGNMLPVFGKHFPNVTTATLKDLLAIMTDGLHTETLLFVAVVSMLSRHQAGEKDSGGFGFGPSIKLSAVTKDKTAKMQSPAMELLHDVVVELPMAGGNFTELQSYLAKHFGATIAMYHSCGDAIVDLADIGAFYQACKAEQYLRTRLDWEAQTQKAAPVELIMESCDYTARDAEVAQHCCNVAMEAVNSVAETADVNLAA